jgi:type IV pilus assembly protein PilV
MKPNPRTRIRSAPAQRGFSLLEVLVSLMLIAIAMLGQAGMQANALKFSKGASFRMQAVMLGNEIGERMEANKTGATAGSYVIATATSTVSTASTDCATASCDATALAAYDLAQWTTRVAANLPSGTWQITRTVTGNPSTYAIVLTWQDRRSDAGRTTYSTTGTSETLSLTTTKVVYQ